MIKSQLNRVKLTLYEFTKRLGIFIPYQNYKDANS